MLVVIIVAVSIVMLTRSSQIKTSETSKSFTARAGDEVEISGTGLKIKIKEIQAENTIAEASYQGSVQEITLIPNEQENVFGYNIYAESVTSNDVTIRVEETTTTLLPETTSTIITTPTTTTPTTVNTSERKTLENAEIGYRLTYPNDWQVKGAIISTGFSNSSDCQSVEINDGLVGTGAIPGFVVNYHSGVQICAKTLDNLTLDQFMQQTYTSNLDNWFTSAQIAIRVEPGGIPIYPLIYYELPGVSTAVKHIFLQTASHRLEIYSFASGVDSEQTVQRTVQVEEIIESFSLI